MNDFLEVFEDMLQDQAGYMERVESGMPDPDGTRLRFQLLIDLSQVVRRVRLDEQSKS